MQHFCGTTTSLDDGQAHQFPGRCRDQRDDEGHRHYGGACLYQRHDTTAVAVAYLSWCEYSNKLVLKHRDGRQIGLGFPEPSKFDTKLDQIIQVRSDDALLKYLHELAASGVTSKPANEGHLKTGQRA